jgi:hypothetical protein
MSVNIDIVSSVPPEIATIILDYLSAKELACAGEVCKKWNQFSSQDVIWKKFAESNSNNVSNDNSKPLKQHVIERLNAIEKAKKETIFTDDKVLFAKIEKFIKNSICKHDFALEYRSASDPYAFAYFFINMGGAYFTEEKCDDTFSKAPIKQKMIGKSKADFAAKNELTSSDVFLYTKATHTIFFPQRGYFGTSWGATQGGILHQTICNIEPTAQKKIHLLLEKYL